MRGLPGNRQSYRDRVSSYLFKDIHTVDRYLDLLEQVFVIYSRCGCSRNLRKEITKSRRYYFVDNGLRNTVITSC